MCMEQGRAVSTPARFWSSAAQHATDLPPCCTGTYTRRVETLGFLIKMFMTGVSVFVYNHKWMSILQLASAAALVYLYWKWLPHMNAVVNYIRVATYASILYAALLLVIISFHPGVDGSDTNAWDKYRCAAVTQTVS